MFITKSTVLVIQISPSGPQGFVEIVFCVSLGVLWHLSNLCHWVGRAEGKYKLSDLGVNEDSSADSRVV